MTDPQHDIRVWMTEQLRAAGHGAKGKLADHLGVRPDAITRMTNTDPDKETREIRGHELLKMQEFFANDPPADAGRSIPVMGYLGAGAEIEPDYEQVPPEGLFQVDLPFALNEDLIAFEVKGDSMLPFYKARTVIIVYRDQKRPIEAFYGDEAAVRTHDGRRFIKTIMRGERGVNLISWNAPPIENVKLEWIGEIFAVLRPAAIKKVERAGGIQGQLKLRTG